MLGVLTYDAPHRKTQDLLLRIKALLSDDVLVIATPWEQRKAHKPLISHRPAEPHWPAAPLPINPADLCNSLGYSYSVIPKDELCLNPPKAKMVLIGGAGILPGEVIRSWPPIINAHPAWIPYGRGLDSLKWAIYKNLPIGATTHIIDDRCDAGTVIERRFIPIYPQDTFHALAHRQYEVEMDMLIGAVEKVREMESSFQPIAVEDGGECETVHRRMPHIKEMIMLRRFESRRDGSE